MKRAIALTVAAVWCASSVHAAERGFNKAYFGATRPGSFARHKATDEKGAVTEYTYARLADLESERVIERRFEVVSGQFKGSGSTTACLVPASFPLENDAIDFQVHARRCVATPSIGAPPYEYPPDTMKSIADVMTNYAAIVTFKGTETVGGRRADRYAYQYEGMAVNAPSTTTGDIWLSDAVPFGLVREVMTTRDASGKTVTRIETVLVESGGGASTALPDWSWSTPAPASEPQ
jgi:hypothetical protein